MSIKVGDFVKGLPGSPYTITTDRMTKGLVTKADGDNITVRIIEHVDGECGVYDVEAKYFEVIGRAKRFNRDEVLELLNSGCKKAILDYDLTNANLTNANLARANLANADLTRANLADANLTDANLTDANLGNADLTNANLANADLTNADLGNANLTYANLTDANLANADLTNANLTYANLTDANLANADLTNANLANANLANADLGNANLAGADLARADLVRANIDFSCWPLWCGSLKVKVDKRIACQLAYHLCSVQCDDAEFIEMRNSILGFANQFHRVDECGVLKPIDAEKFRVNNFDGGLQSS